MHICIGLASGSRDRPIVLHYFTHYSLAALHLQTSVFLNTPPTKSLITARAALSGLREWAAAWPPRTGAAFADRAPTTLEAYIADPRVRPMTDLFQPIWL